jgi:hypothetical protein
LHITNGDFAGLPLPLADLALALALDLASLFLSQMLSAYSIVSLVF